MVYWLPRLRTDTDVNLLLEAAKDEAERNRWQFSTDRSSGWTADEWALQSDQTAIAEDFTTAVINVLMMEHPVLLTIVLTALIGRKSRSDVKYAAKMRGVVKFNDEELSRLVVNLTRLRESRNTDDPSTGDQ